MHHQWQMQEKWTKQWRISSFSWLIEAETKGHHLADDIFNCIVMNKNVWIPIKISLKFFPKGRINNIPAMVQIMAWRRPGDKPLSEPMMKFTDAYMHHSASMSQCICSRDKLKEFLMAFFKWIFLKYIINFSSHAAYNYISSINSLTPATRAIIWPNGC